MYFLWYSVAWVQLHSDDTCNCSTFCTHTHSGSPHNIVHSSSWWDVNHWPSNAGLDRQTPLTSKWQTQWTNGWSFNYYPFRDFGQLPPVGDRPLYTPHSSSDLSIHGHTVYNMFTIVVFLSQILWQSGSTQLLNLSETFSHAWEMGTSPMMIGRCYWHVLLNIQKMPITSLMLSGSFTQRSS